ncbi:hypothetical protein P280DRAFT_482984 [Massarina eburnea CBS 473.64]|uniref:Amidoligase enzyme n=1 Tax=Massarina eburnea CBS 473.64 TaxID=1395130 RepID=A0A6A6RR27_9PLEO|nr:hypothetical protein P280DRAFT_482984 [Massarina eburnea CBS 473.64]
MDYLDELDNSAIQALTELGGGIDFLLPSTTTTTATIKNAYPSSACPARRHRRVQATYLLRLEHPLSEPRDVANAIGLSRVPQLETGSGEDGEERFCRLSQTNIDALDSWAAECHPGKKFTKIRLGIAHKEPELPVLGRDPTLPHHRASVEKKVCYPVYYFFYGTLASPSRLSRLFDIPLSQLPRLEAASILGGRIKTWAGKYRALVDSPGDKVEGARRFSLSTASPVRAAPRLAILPPISPSPPASPSPPTSPVYDHLPFNFGAEFELIIRPKDISSLSPDARLPDFDASHRQMRDFNRALLRVVSKLLSDSGFACKVFDPNEDEEAKPDYSQWHTTLDASLSKGHTADGFYPVEIVTPVVKADATWVATIDKFWSIMQRHFELRRDTSCGMHIHISPQQGKFDIDQLRRIAKAVVLWERDTARCAPPSRDDHAQDFCLSNVKGRVPVADDLWTHGPLRGIRHAFRHIDHASRNEIVRYVCPDKHRAWNFLPARETGHGSVEFRRPPGVVTAKKAKHWIAFTMAFVDMAMRTNLGRIARWLPKYHHRRSTTISRPTFEFDDLLLASADKLGLYATLDPRLRQSDEPRSLHITMMRPDYFDWLRRFDDDYHHMNDNA